jgi:hypothetical protein
LKEIGTCFSISESGVSQAGCRIEMKIAEDWKLRGKVKAIESRIEMSNVEI